MEQLYPTRKLTWPEAAKLAQKRVEEILHKEVPCQMALEDETYWTLYSPTYMFSTQELELLLQAGRVTKEVWEEAIPQEGNASHSLGMELTRLLLSRPCTASGPRSTARKRAFGCWTIAPAVPKSQPFGCLVSG